MAARTRSVLLGHSKWPLEIDRLRQGARNCSRFGCSKTMHIPTFPTLSPLGSAGALEMAARARSAQLGRSKWLHELGRLGWFARTTFPTSSPLGSAEALDIGARARSDPLRHSEWPLDPARLCWDARNGSSNSLGSARCSAWLLEDAALAETCDIERVRFRWALEIGGSNSLGSARPKTLHRAIPRMLVALSTEMDIVVHGMHGPTLVHYIYIYIYMNHFITHPLIKLLRQPCFFIKPSTRN